MLQAGQQAPDFTLQDSDGNTVRLADFRGNKHVVLYFYPKDDTPGCTVEAQDFTALRERFEALDTVVLGISRDDCASHAAFREKYRLTVQLLADTSADACLRYGVWQEKEKDGQKRMGIVRSTFVIDKDGVVRHALYGVKAEAHAEEVLGLVGE